MTADHDSNRTQLEFDVEMDRVGAMETERLAPAHRWDVRAVSPNAVAQALRRGWWVVLATVALALLIGAILTARQKPLFRASTTVVVVPARETNETGDILRSLETLERRTVVATFSKIPGTPETRLAAAQTLGITLDQLHGYRLQGSVLPNTNIIRIDVEGNDRDTVADLANAAAVVTNRKARDLYKIYALKTLGEAVPPNRPVHPDRRRNYAAALVIGALVGSAAAVGWALLGPALRSPR